MNIHELCLKFLKIVREGKIEIYNEASIQFELGIFLRAHLYEQETDGDQWKVQFERNVSHFGLNKEEFEKKEMDLVIFNQSREYACAIERKNPLHGQVPEQIFSFCKDLRFLEQLKAQGFRKGLFLMITDNHLFWKNGMVSIFTKCFVWRNIFMEPSKNPLDAKINRYF